MGLFDFIFGSKSSENYSGNPKEDKHDLEAMKRCCKKELNQMKKDGLVPAPYCFERVAILSKKEKDYEQEVKYCEIYLEAVNQFYETHGTQGRADVREGSRYKSIKERLPKARKRLNNKQ